MAGVGSEVDPKCNSHRWQVIVADAREACQDLGIVLMIDLAMNVNRTCDIHSIVLAHGFWDSFETILDPVLVPFLNTLASFGRRFFGCRFCRLF